MKGLTTTKTGIMKKVFAFIFLSLFIFGTTIAQPISEREQAIKDAERDVRGVTIDNCLTGVGTGFGVCILTFAVFLYENNSRSSGQFPIMTTVGLLGTSAIGAFYLQRTSVPAGKLLGKSPEYVSYYTKTYQKNVRAIRTGAAAIGCFTGFVVSVKTLLFLTLSFTYD